MYDYNDRIQSYETDCVNLPQTIKDKLRDHREANRERLKNALSNKIRINDNHFIPQGSMAIQTTVQEKDNSYDIDDGVWIYEEDLRKDDGAEYTARETQEIVLKALEDPKFDKKPEIHGNCVRVFYKEGHHVDVPAYRKFDEGTELERQELAGENGWTASDPTEINRWFEERVKKLNRQREGLGNQLRKMIRLLKRFARSRCDSWDMPNGLKLTMLTEEKMPTSYELDDECFYWLMSILGDRLSNSLEIENRAQIKAPRDKLTKSSADPNMIELRNHIAEALEKLRTLHHPQCTQKQAREVWEWIFQSGGYFEAYDNDPAKTRTLFTKTALINAGIAGTDSSGVIGSVKDGARIPNPPHKFYGDVPKE